MTAASEKLRLARVRLVEASDTLSNAAKGLARKALDPHPPYLHEPAKDVIKAAQEYDAARFYLDRMVAGHG